MNVTTAILVFTVLLNLLLVYFVYKSNPKRLSNRVFVLPGVHISLWALAFVFIVNAATAESVERWIRMAFMAGSLIPLSFLILVYSVGEKRISPLANKKGFTAIAVIGAANLILSFAPGLFTEMGEPVTGSIPEASFGLPFYLFYVLFFISIAYCFVFLLKKLKGSKGLARAEIQYILLGWLTASLFVIFVMFLFPVIFQSTVFVRFSPVSILIMNLFVGYGIAKYKILDSSVLLSRVLSSTLVWCAVFVIFVLLSKVLEGFFLFRKGTHPLLPEAVALVAIVVVFERLSRWVKGFVGEKIFRQEYTAEDLLEGLESVLYTVGDVKLFLVKCLKIILDNIGIRNGLVFFTGSGEGQAYIFVSSSGNVQQEGEHKISPDKIISFFEKNRHPLIRGTLERRIHRGEEDLIIEEMEDLGIDIAIPLINGDKLSGILGFGEKKSGRFYTPQDEEVFYRLSHYISLKVQSFMLYQQLEGVKTYQEALLENLPLGVIGISDNGNITIVNKEAERITGLDEKEVLGVAFKKVLPDPVSKFLSETVNSRKDLRHVNLTLDAGGKPMFLDANSSVFYDNKGIFSGTQVIFADVTRVKELEEGVRRADKLASLGGMAAGLAHEIKNPLVSIRTFAYLLPERYNDKDFRDTFSGLVVDEVERINDLIEQILLFARPDVSRLEEMNLVDIMKSMLLLVSVHLVEKNITLKQHFASEEIVVEGDSAKLKQAFLNIVLNSSEAVFSNGFIGIDVYRKGTAAVVDITDNGCGIKQAIVEKIFEPFFTTRQKGTGLGLSIVSRIIEEHKGSIVIESAEGKGTKVHVELPLAISGDA